MGVLRTYKNVGELLHNLFGYKETSKWMLAHHYSTFVIIKSFFSVVVLKHTMSKRNKLLS